MLGDNIHNKTIIVLGYLLIPFVEHIVHTRLQDVTRPQGLMHLAMPLVAQQWFASTPWWLPDGWRKLDLEVRLPRPSMVW